MLRFAHGMAPRVGATTPERFSAAAATSEIESEGQSRVIHRRYHQRGNRAPGEDRAQRRDRHEPLTGIIDRQPPLRRRALQELVDASSLEGLPRPFR